MVENESGIRLLIEGCFQTSRGIHQQRNMRNYTRNYSEMYNIKIINGKWHKLLKKCLLFICLYGRITTVLADVAEWQTQQTQNLPGVTP